jgi:hypothetical protein
VGESVVQADLATWLLACVDEDEEFARDAMQRSWRATDNHVEDLDDSEVARFNLKPDARHAARWGPARVLAECDTKRRIIAECRGLSDTFPGELVGLLGDAVLSYLALPYRDRPGYRAEWSPDGR